MDNCVVCFIELLGYVMSWFWNVVVIGCVV